MKKFFLSTIVALLMAMVGVTAKAAVTITAQGGWFESAYVEFTPDGSSYYNVYYSTNQSSWTKIDDQLVRKYSSSKGRADVLGIAAGTYYIKVASVNANGAEVGSVVSKALNVKAHDRSGFAHFNNANKVGAYKDDGTLKSGANILYITKSNAKTITMTVPSASNKTAIYTGLQTIINAWTKAYSSGWSSAPLDIRVLGTLSYDDMDTFSSSAEGIQIKGASNYSNCPITFEGVGNDAVIHGFGFLIRNMSNLELRNFAIMNCLDDAVSIDSNNSHIWVHNLDLFYGNAGSDKDQVKGDGTVDMKGDSQYLTISYNHFWDTGKSSLCGMKSESGPNYITYHHNWFDHSDSRHPRIRTMSVHVYNNYFDGVSKYGTGVTMGSSCFVDRNYYRSCKYPMLSSMQGSDVYAGTTTRNPGSYGTFSSENSGIIKSYGNYMTGNCTYITYGATTYLLHGETTSVGSIKTNQDFDAYEVSNPATPVPSNVTGYQGGSTYNNFDTDPSLMYSYTADNAQDVPSVVQGAYGAGRMQHGTYQHTFTSADDTDYGVIASLKSDVQGYKSTSYYVGVTNSMYYKENVINDSPVEPGEGEEEEPETPTTSTDATLKSLSVSGYSLSFSPSTTYYAVTLNYGTETAPTVSAAANNSAATVLITQATSTTGKATVKVTAEDGSTIKIYEVQFSVAAEPVEPTPAGTIISTALTLNIGDGSNAYQGYLTGTYNTSTSCNATYGSVTNNSLAIKMESSTSISFTTTKAFTMTFVADGSQTASFKIDGTTVAASSGNTASVDVAAGTHTLTKSGAIKMCFLDFAETSDPIEPEPVLSDDATLSALSVAGYSLTPAFSSSTFTYSVELAAGTTSVPTITATPNHANAHAYVDAESCHPAGQAIIDVEAEDGTSGKYYINFTVATAYYNVSALAGSGGSATVSPSGSVAEGTQVTFTATANDGFTFSKWSDDSTENPRNVTVTGDLTLTASFTAQSTGGNTLFSASVTTAPSEAVTVATSSSVDLSAYATITGGTMTFYNKRTDKSQDVIVAGATNMSVGSGKNYFAIALNSALAEGDVISFTTPDSHELNINTSSTSSSGGITTSSQLYTVTGSDALVGQTAIYVWRNVGSGTTNFNNFTITREDSPAPASTDATLSDLQVNGTTVTGFSAETLSYDVTLPYGTTAIPTVTYTVNDNKASSVLNNASALPGSTTVTVTAEDGTTTKTYTVNFTVLQSIVLVDGEDYTATEDVTYADGVTYTRTFNSKLVNKWTSFYVPFAVNVEDYLTQFDIAEIFAMCPVFDTNHDGEVTAEDEAYLILMKKTSGTTQPNKPYLIRAKSEGVQEIEAVDGKVYAAANGTISCATTNNSYTFTGVYSPVTANPENGYWYMSGGSLSHKTSGSANISSNRWYMEVSDVDKYNSTSSTQNSINIAVIGEDMDNATAVNAIKQSKGQLTDRIYNLGGVQVDANYRGISIKNGKAYIK